MFWDSSAIIPLFLEESPTRTIRGIVNKDAAIATWWGSLIECYSTFARLRRERVLKPAEESSASFRVNRICEKGDDDDENEQRNSRMQSISSR